LILVLEQTTFAERTKECPTIPLLPQTGNGMLFPHQQASHPISVFVSPEKSIDGDETDLPHQQLQQAHEQATQAMAAL
jgi:hypothetical protein